MRIPKIDFLSFLIYFALTSKTRPSTVFVLPGLSSINFVHDGA